MNYYEFRKKYNICLNQQQEKAVVRTKGQTLLLAVPGSGKTTVIVARIGYMLLCNNIPSEHILTMTYNVSAAADMKQRFISKFGAENLGRLEFRTINGFCATVIMFYEQMRNTRAFRLIEESGTTSIIRAIYIDMTNEFPSESTIKEIKTQLVYSRNMMLNENEIKKIKVGEMDFYDFFTRYKDYKHKNKIMDFDDQLEFALKILVKNPDILSFYQNRYRYVNIDEAQDTSKIQHIIIRLLVKKHKNIFMVGDEDQSIYGFRAAYPEALLEFDKVYPEGMILLMEKNYRSTRDIVEKANNFIKLNKNRHEKNMSADSSVSIPVKNIIMKDYKFQYNYIIKMISQSDEQLAILYRNNESALPIIDLLEKSNIDFRLKESDGLFFSVNTVNDILNILRFSCDSSDSALFCDFYYKIGVQIKKNIVFESAELYKNSSSSFFTSLSRHRAIESWQIKKLHEIQSKMLRIKKMDSYKAVLSVLNDLEYSKYIKERGLDEAKIRTLLAIANQNPDIDNFLTRVNDLKEIVINGSNPESNIILSTIHSSKGLEYENVLMIDVRDGIFPSVAIEKEDEKNMPENIINTLEEERRLFYVGVTRAKKLFEIFSYEREYGKPCDTAVFTKQLLNITSKKSTDKTEKYVKEIIPAKQCTQKSIIKAENVNLKKQLLKYQPGTEITHKKYGPGIIQDIHKQICKVRISDGSVHSFDIEYCIKNKIISLNK